MTRDDFLAPMQATPPTPAPLPLTPPLVSVQAKIGQYADSGEYSPGSFGEPRSRVHDDLGDLNDQRILHDHLTTLSTSG